MKFSGTRTEKCHNRLSAFGVSGPIRAFISGVVVSIGHNRLSAFGVSGPHGTVCNLVYRRNRHNRLSAFGVIGTPNFRGGIAMYTNPVTIAFRLLG